MAERHFFGLMKEMGMDFLKNMTLRIFTMFLAGVLALPPQMPLPAQPSANFSNTNFTNQALIERPAAALFSSAAFARMFRLFRTRKASQDDAIEDLTPTRLQTRRSHAWRELRWGLGLFLPRQLLTAGLTFLMYDNLKKIDNPALVMAWQWGPITILIALIWAATRLYRWITPPTTMRDTLAAPVTPVLNGDLSHWFEKAARLPYPILMSAMMLANLSSQWCSIKAVQTTGPVTAAATNQSQGLMLFLIGVLFLGEKRFWQSRILVTSVFLVGGLIQPATAWATGAPVTWVGIVWGILAAASGAALLTGFKILSYSPTEVDARMVSLLGAAATSAAGFIWICAQNSWQWQKAVDIFVSVPAAVAFSCCLFGMAKLYQYMSTSRIIQSKDLSRTGWGQSFSLPVHIGVNAGVPAVLKIFGISQSKFEHQDIGFLSHFAPFLIDTFGIYLAISQVDSPGLRGLMMEREQVAQLIEKWKFPVAGISGSSSLFEGPLSLLAPDTAMALQRHGLVPLDAGGPGQPQEVRRWYAFARQQTGAAPDPNNRMQSVSADIRLREDVAPFVESILRVNHLNARKMAQTRGTLGQIIFPGGIGTMDELFEMIANGRPVVLVEPAGGSYWENLFERMFLRIDSYVAIAHPGDDAIHALRRLAKRFPLPASKDISAENRELETYWNQVNRPEWRKAFVMVGRPSKFYRPAAQALSTALLSQDKYLRLASGGTALWKLVLAAARALKVKSHLQAVLHVPTGGRLLQIEREISNKIVLTSRANHQVLFARKDLGFIFFWEEGQQAVETWNLLLDLINQMRMGKMNAVPILLFGRAWRTRLPFNLEETPFLRIAETIEDALKHLGVEPKNSPYAARTSV